MKRVLIFDNDVKGHHLEYIHHLYSAACDSKDTFFYFLTTADFINVQERLTWKKSSNVELLFLNEQEKKKCEERNLLLAAWYKSNIISKYARELSIDKVWLIMIMLVMPFLPFLLPKNCQITGILYRLYFYEGTTMKGFRGWMNKLRYQVLAHHHKVDRVLVLNDTWGVEKLNKTYHTSKFKLLLDPVPIADNGTFQNLRIELEISPDSLVYLHFGALEERKGTLEILKAICMLPESEGKKRTFVFAGVVDETIKHEFQILVAEARENSRVLVFDRYCAYEFLMSLCNISDCILIPYTNTNQSSGVIGYASYFKKPVIGPSSGLLGRLIREYRLGLSFEKVDSSAICQALQADLPEGENQYAKEHSIEAFVEPFFSKGKLYGN